MKLAIAILLCGLSCCWASPVCNDDEANKCSTGREIDHNRFYPETQAELEPFCRDGIKELDCQISFTDRCPNTLIGAMRKALVLYREAAGKICAKDSALGKKLVEKASCINKEERAGETTCSEKVTENEYCKRTDLVLQCAEEELNKRCGSDGSEVYTMIYNPKHALKEVFCRGIEEE